MQGGRDQRQYDSSTRSLVRLLAFRLPHDYFSPCAMDFQKFGHIGDREKGGKVDNMCMHACRVWGRIQARGGGVVVEEACAHPSLIRWRGGGQYEMQQGGAMARKRLMDHPGIGIFIQLSSALCATFSFAIACGIPHAFHSLGGEEGCFCGNNMYASIGID
ncbi:hypothetical protein DFH27DRAFT_108868 [Peziza echinospora]|nr:hypothetical protein DFH27DRAFT_108868 [Peziza echinospora]